jgi:hypothetical protein
LIIPDSNIACLASISKSSKGEELDVTILNELENTKIYALLTSLSLNALQIPRFKTAYGRICLRISKGKSIAKRCVCNYFYFLRNSGEQFVGKLKALGVGFPIYAEEGGNAGVRRGGAAACSTVPRSARHPTQHLLCRRGDQSSAGPVDSCGI